MNRRSLPFGKSHNYSNKFLRLSERMLIFTFFVLFLVFIHDLTMTELGNNSIIEKRVLLMFLVAVQVTGEENYSETKCSSPLGWYKAVGCTAVRANLNDRCARSCDCCHLDNLSRDKCYVNGNEYSIGEMLNRWKTTNVATEIVRVHSTEIQIEPRAICSIDDEFMLPDSTSAHDLIRNCCVFTWIDTQIGFNLNGYNRDNCDLVEY